MMLKNTPAESLYSYIPGTLDTIEVQTLPLSEAQKLRGFREALPEDIYLTSVEDNQVMCVATVYNMKTLKTAKATVFYLWGKNSEKATLQAITEAKKITD